MSHQKPVSVSGIVIVLFVLLNIAVLKEAYISNVKWYWALLVTLPLLLLAIFNARQKKHPILRNNP